MFAQRYFETSLAASVALWLPVGILIAFWQYDYSVPYFFCIGLTPLWLAIQLRKMPGGQGLGGKRRLLVETGLVSVAGIAIACMTRPWLDVFDGASFTHLSRGLMYGSGAGALWYTGALTRAAKQRRGPFRQFRVGGRYFMTALATGIGVFVGWVSTAAFTFFWTWDRVDALPSFLPVPVRVVLLTTFLFAPIGALLSVAGEEASKGRLQGNYGGSYSYDSSAPDDSSPSSSWDDD